MWEGRELGGNTVTVVSNTCTNCNTLVYCNIYFGTYPSQC